MPPKGTVSSCLRFYAKSLTSYVQGGLPICIGRVYIGTMLNQISNHLPRTETQVKMGHGSKLKVTCSRWMQKHNLTRCMLFIYCMQCKKRGSRSPNDRSTISTSRTVVNLSDQVGWKKINHQIENSPWHPHFWTCLPCDCPVQLLLVSVTNHSPGFLVDV